MTNDYDGNNNINSLPEEIRKSVGLYKQNDSVGKLVIFSLLDHKKYSKQFIMDNFDCSRYAVDVARKWNASNIGLMIPQKHTFARSRLDLQKCEHFLDFIIVLSLCIFSQVRNIPERIILISTTGLR